VAREARQVLIRLFLLAWLLACQRATVGDRVTLGVSRLRISLPIFVAVERGLFAKHGVTVELRVFDTAQPMIDAALAGEVDAAGFVAYPIVLLSSQGAARPLQVATSLIEDGQHRISYVLARAGSGLAFPRQAGGRRIGILPTAAYRAWLGAILDAAGVDPATVTIVPVAPPLQASTLAAGGVDFLFTNDPMATRIVASGLGEIADDGPPCAKRLADPFTFGTFALSARLSAERPELAARVVAALDEAILAIRADPARAGADLARHLRPDERPFVDRYPPSRYLTSAEAAGSLVQEVALERALHLLERAPTVTEWAR
jgi:NitT/TauT family transport system substrate-binding protein